MKQAAQFLENLPQGRKLALSILLIHILGMLWVFQGGVWKSVGLQGNILIIALVSLNLVAMLGIVSLQSQLRQLGAAPARLQEVAEALAIGDLDVDLSLSRPPDSVYAAMQTLQKCLRSRVVEQQEALAEHARIKHALNRVGTAVMLSDANQKITYMNSAGTEFFREAAVDICKVLPGFNADELLGKSTGLFFRNPFQNQAMANLNAEYRSEIKLGTRTFKVIANPLMSAENKRLGSVVEWFECTRELAIAREVRRVVQYALAGDLGQRVSLDNKDDVLEDLAKGVNEMVGLADRIMTDTVLGLGTLISGTEEISRGNTHWRRLTKRQATSLEAAASSMAEMSRTITQHASCANEAARLSVQARQKVCKGVDIVGRARIAMQDISRSSRDIAGITRIIEEIAARINALAMSSSLEVSLSGDKDGVFAEVADEIRTLAERSLASAKEIKVVIEASAANVDIGTRLVNQSRTSLKEIGEDARKTSDAIGRVAADCTNQISGVDRVRKALSRTDDRLQQSKAPERKMAAATSSMRACLDDLEQSMRSFSKSSNTTINTETSSDYPTAVSNPDFRPRTGVILKSRRPQLTLLKFPQQVLIDD